MTDQPKSPWWQLTRTPGQGFAIGGFFAVAGPLAIVSSLTEDGARGGPVLMGVSWVVMAGCYLASAVATRRRAVS